ncbi:MAG: helicase-related protein [Bacteroidia bacterium]|nr:DEAD/DEAH box helicase [Bacteroidia bacterium]MDW8157280.1 helicase-related protein [Bacteroidia bacterium]
MEKLWKWTVGSLVSVYGRPCVVYPKEFAKGRRDNWEEVFIFQPIDGIAEERIGLYSPYHNDDSFIQEYTFPFPSVEEIGNLASAHLLYQAARLSSKEVAGPFRVLGKISFQPRAYQIVPLILALQQDPIRLLIADDVGIGKTIEALLIAYELFLRKEIDRFAILCPPHLCDQWQSEIQSKFGIFAPILRPATAAALQRKASPYQSLFHSFEILVISIDYIKMPVKGEAFVENAPPLIIVDEAHTAARPADSNQEMQMRYSLLRQLASRPGQSLILLTATPHSGKEEEFCSLLGLLRPEWENIQFSNLDEAAKQALASHFIQRRRSDVINWMNENTAFPQRITHDLVYELSKEYSQIFVEILEYARQNILSEESNSSYQFFRYLEAIALLKSIMSSPEAGVSALENKASKIASSSISQENAAIVEAQLLEKSDILVQDTAPLSLLLESSDVRVKKWYDFAKRLKSLANLKHDVKAQAALEQITTWLDSDFQPVVFCHYIQTAKYLGELFKEVLQPQYSDLQIEVITGELSDEVRKEKIRSLMHAPKRLLIATDCLSEGINLQEGFNALIHYDLPWNPNRLEQREGRVDRFGQFSPRVEIRLLYGKNNPIDGAILDVLIKKAREIRQTIGITVPFPEDSSSVMKAITSAILLKDFEIEKQPDLSSISEISIQKKQIAQAYEEVIQKEQTIRSIFSHSQINAEVLRNFLEEATSATGGADDVEKFVLQTFTFWGCEIEKLEEFFDKNPAQIRLYRIHKPNMPSFFQDFFSKNGTSFQVAFHAPAPNGYQFIGRNHPFIESLTLYLLNATLEKEGEISDFPVAARAAVIKTDSVNLKTTLCLLRLRNVLYQNRTLREYLAEEIVFWGYNGDISDGNILSLEQAKDLFLQAQPKQNISLQEAQLWMREELEEIKSNSLFKSHFLEVTAQRSRRWADNLNQVRSIFKKGDPYREQFTPKENNFLPDLLGLYILLPCPPASPN